ncbi:MAG: 2-aminoethylphosphonate aminotransferase [Jaaginema sp. PMC 1079.18]|nr:2-aminoethylphosphonate aminotransferase [Jaaginema sp. PMC 1080.18]MEC4851870.1 2-aminoethylphosphonate aminotransferase [Jaaginema sp. PMC 1079.18]MEC4866434.1 2-aminoethylphosphonate aminotransferase [Jaaginema sp. PMC 1078.18]
MLLLNPGPVTLSEKVRNALTQEDLCHREPEFAQLTLDLKQRLLHIYPEIASSYDAVLLTGSGTCAVEAMLASFIPPQGKALVVANGVYGDRLAAMIKAHGKPLEIITSPWQEAINCAAVERCLQQDRTITHLVTVHHETTTGRLNNLALLGQLASQFNIPLLLDGVSSFGVEKIDFSAWNIAAVAATANKCLHGVPGLSFVLAKSTLFQTQTSAANSLYLDLYRYQKAQITGYSPFTQAVQVYYGLQAALQELEAAGGWLARQKSYTKLAQKIRQGLQQQGVKLLLPESDYSCALTSFMLPPYLSYFQLHKSLKKAGFIIYAGQGNFQDKIFRIANMGNIQIEDIAKLLDCCSSLFKN